MHFSHFIYLQGAKINPLLKTALSNGEKEKKVVTLKIKIKLYLSSIYKKNKEEF
jgi:hypothetical protein